MGNILENKEKFFAQYWGQKIAFFQLGLEVGEFTIKMDSEFQALLNKPEYGLEKAFIKLKPLSDITDEDLKVIGLDNHINKTESIYKDANHFLKEIEHMGFFTQFESDFLRSKGYVLPWMGLSVDKLIEYGWVKLKTLNK